MNIALRWKNLLKDPQFKDVPYKIELKNSGQILMSPASNWHAYAQGETAGHIKKRKKNGKVLTECSIQTRLGVFVPDVAWASDEFIEKYQFKTPYPFAPELCIEVISPSNSDVEINNKIGLYLEKGALEVWTILENGKVNIYTTNGIINKSNICKLPKI